MGKYYKIFNFLKDDDNEEVDIHKKAFKVTKSKPLTNSASSCSSSINIANSLSNNSSGSTSLLASPKPKLSSQTVNNLAKKIINQNSSILPVGSIAASSSLAVSSASSLTTSLAKLNFK